MSVLGPLLARKLTQAFFGSVQGFHGAPLICSEDMQITSEDGSKLEAALFLAPRELAQGVVILCHPFLKYGMRYFTFHHLPAKLTQRGFHVVLFNFKGFGRSTVGGHEFALDILGVTAWTAARFGRLPMFHLGSSFGGFHLAHALGKRPNAFSSIVLDSVPVSIPRFFQKGLTARIMRGLSQSQYAEATGTCDIEHSLARAGNAAAITYVYGSADPYIPHVDVALLRSQFSRMRFAAFEGFSHLQCHQETQRFLDCVVGPTAPTTPLVMV